MSRIIDVIRRVVAEELALRRDCVLGVVTATHPHGSKDDSNNYEVDVRLKHEDLVLDRLPVAVGHLGEAAALKVGDLVLVQFVDGDLNQGLVTGRFYHADERPPLHKDGELLFEQRVPDGTLNHLRFTDDGTIHLQRDVTKPEDNSEYKTSLTIDGATGDVTLSAPKKKTSVRIENESGNIEIKAGDKIVVTLQNDGAIKILADGKPLDVTCQKMTVTGDMKVTGNVEVNGELTVGDSASNTKISKNVITGT